MGNAKIEPLFETHRVQGTALYRIFSTSIAAGVILIWFYRATHVPGAGENGRLGWLGLFCAELWFGFYWIIGQSLRWNRVRRQVFPDRLAKRLENELPKVDIFVCTADPEIEPPIMVINTVLSVMAYDYPKEKLSVYLSDDGGSQLTFYAMVEAARFSKHWIPYCSKFNVEPRSPAAYFTSLSNHPHSTEFSSIKKLYEDMEGRIETACKLGQVPEDARLEHRGFSKWSPSSTRGNHDSIVQILIDGKDPEAVDEGGCAMPNLVYMSREKRPQYFHNFKAGAMNALIRVSGDISNAPVILNVDCDMYSNNSRSIRDALCFFMDEGEGHEIGFVQFPQKFKNVTKNDLYGSSLCVIEKIEFYGLDGYGGPLYIGTGCFHRRDILCGRKFSQQAKIKLETNRTQNTKVNMQELEEKVKNLASCKYEENTQWGEEIGLKYGCPVEDVITGLSIQCNGWKSAYLTPERAAFLGLAATTLNDALVQHKRWSEGDLQILLSKYSPPIYGLGKIHIGLVLGYCNYCLWAVNSLATLYYSIFPTLYLFKGIPLFPKVSSIWFLPFAYVILAELTYSLFEFLYSEGTILGWWNEQRIWLYKRTSSYLFAAIDTIINLLGLSSTGFVVSSKVSEKDVAERFEKEIMEFGISSPFFATLSSLAMVNLFGLMWVVKQVVIDGRLISSIWETMALQIVVCGALVLINIPLYLAQFMRKDSGRMPTSVSIKSTAFALFACIFVTFLN